LTIEGILKNFLLSMRNFYLCIVYLVLFVTISDLNNGWITWTIYIFMLTLDSRQRTNPYGYPQQ
jgi:hypothetical protein